MGADFFGRVDDYYTCMDLQNLINMTTPDRIWLTAALALFMLLQALYQARRFKANKPISHPLHGLYRALAIVALWAFFWHWKALVLGVMQSLGLFDLILSLCRKRGLFYDGGPEADSWLDRLEWRITDGHVWALKVTYIVVWLALLIWL
jgi:hypothetical protein